MTKVAALIPFGPGERELERVADLLESLWTYEPHAVAVIVDDDQSKRDLRERLRVAEGYSLVRLVNPYAGRPRRSKPAWGPLCVKTLLGLAWIEEHLQPEVVARMDTDALVIAPFAERVGRFFNLHPEVGQVSAYRHDCNGKPRGFKMWQVYTRRLSAPFSISRRRPRFMLNLRGPSAKIRSLIKDALANGYNLGENCFGGATVISGACLRRMRDRGYLDDPGIWYETRMGDDAMMGIYVAAVGMKLADMGEGDVLGVKWKGLPDSPERLLERGFALIHSLKTAPDAKLTEEDLRDFFRAQRAADKAKGLAGLPQAHGRRTGDTSDQRVASSLQLSR